MSFARGGGRAAGRVPDGIQHASFGQLERGSSAGDCRARWGDGRAGVRAVGGRALPVVRGHTQPADPAPGGGPPADASACTIICTGSIPSSAGCTCGCRPGHLTRSRSTSTVGSGWRGRWTRPASGIGASDNKITQVDDFGAVRRCASGSPTPTGRRSWSGRQPWSIRCCPTSNAPASPATGGSSTNASTPAMSCSPTVPPWRRSRAIW